MFNSIMMRNGAVLRLLLTSLLAENKGGEGPLKVLENPSKKVVLKDETRCSPVSSYVLKPKHKVKQQLRSQQRLFVS